jgi:hypothetical protein
MQEQSSAMYDAARNTPGDVLDEGPLLDQAAAVRNSLGNLATPNKVIPAGLLARVERLGGEGLAEGEAPPALTTRDIVDVMPELANTETRARAAQNYALADNVRAFRGSLNQTLEDAAASGDAAAQAALDAQTNYRETIGETFGRGPGDAGKKFRKDFNLDRENRTTTPPSQTAERFLKPGQPEKAQALDRIIAQSANPTAGRTAARDYLMSDLAESGAVDAATNRINLNVLRKWRDNWGESLDIVPGLRQEVDQTIQRVQNGAQAATRLEGEVTAANGRLSDAQKNKGALDVVLNKNPENAVRDIFGSGDPEKAMAGIVAEIGGNAQARNGLKAAVRDWLVENKTTSAVHTTSSGANPVSFDQLDKLLKQHEGVLSQVYTPEEMRSLRAAHKMLASGKSRELQATSGSATAERANEQANLRMLEIGLKGWYGILKGGGVFRTIKLYLSTLPSSKEGVEQLINQMAFDPELAQHLLTRKVDVGGPAWNAKLNKLLAVGGAARATQEDEGK